MRTFSMLMVLLVHCVFFSCGFPTTESLAADPAGSFYYCYIESLALVCVNCFILISGYLGIKVKLKNILNILFIVFFYKVASLIIASLSMGSSPYSIKQIAKFFFGYEPDWFIWAYLFMLIFVPMINSYVERASKHNLMRLIIIYIAVELFSLLAHTFGFSFASGYSTLSFIGLYLIGRYYRIHQEQAIKGDKRRIGAGIYLASTLTATALYVISAYLGETVNCKMANLFQAYSSPFVICSSVGVLIFFTSLQFQSKFVNWLGASAFSIYLIHLNPFVLPYFMDAARWIMGYGWPWLWVPFLAIFICCVYFACTVADQSRILCWRKLLELTRSDKPRISSDSQRK